MISEETQEEIKREVLSALCNYRFRRAYMLVEDLERVSDWTLDQFENAANQLGDCGIGGSLMYETAKDLAKLLKTCLYVWSPKERNN